MSDPCADQVGIAEWPLRKELDIVRITVCVVEIGRIGVFDPESVCDAKRDRSLLIVVVDAAVRAWVSIRNRIEHKAQLIVDIEPVAQIDTNFSLAVVVARTGKIHGRCPGAKKYTGVEIDVQPTLQCAMAIALRDSPVDVVGGADQVTIKLSRDDSVTREN